MPSVISVITAVHEPHLSFLDDAHESLAAQTLPQGWDWEWLVQVDGPGETTIGTRDRSRISVGGNRASGPAATRTMALARAAGGLVRTLDADDRLVPGALGRDIDVLTAYDDIGWTVGPAVNLHPDGSTSGSVRGDPKAGRLPRGWLLETWAEAGWSHLPVHPATMCVRTDLLVMLGGWMALPTSEDTGLLLAASQLRDGWFHEEPAILHRRHPGQVTADADHRDPAQSELRRRLIVARAAALATTVTTPDRPHTRRG